MKVHLQVSERGSKHKTMAPQYQMSPSEEQVAEQERKTMAEQEQKNAGKQKSVEKQGEKTLALKEKKRKQQELKKQEKKKRVLQDEEPRVLDEEAQLLVQEAQILVQRKNKRARGVYCICQTTEVGSDGMVQCTGCKDWFHFKCVGFITGGSKSNI